MEFRRRSRISFPHFVSRQLSGCCFNYHNSDDGFFSSFFHEIDPAFVLAKKKRKIICLSGYLSFLSVRVTFSHSIRNLHFISPLSIIGIFVRKNVTAQSDSYTLEKLICISLILISQKHIWGKRQFQRNLITIKANYFLMTERH